jgi:hypothetical protein
VVQERDNLVDDRAGAAIEPDTLLPSQYFDRVRRHTAVDGERRLMVAVLEDGVATYLKHVGADEPHARALRGGRGVGRERRRDLAVLFENICAVLDLDAAYLRRGLRAKKGRVAPAMAPEPPADLDAVERRRASGE